MHFFTFILPFFLSNALTALPLARQNLDLTNQIWGTGIYSNERTLKPELKEAEGSAGAPRMTEGMRPAIAYDIPLSTKNQQLSEEEIDRAEHTADYRDPLQIHSDAKGTKLKPRSKTPTDDQGFETLRHEASVYHYEFVGSQHAEKRKMLEAKPDSDPEKQRYRHLKDAFNRYRRVTGSRNKHGPAPPRPDVSQYTLEEVEVLHGKHKEFLKRYYVTEEGKAERKRLKSRQGTAEELAEFDDLHNGYKEYARWEDWDRVKAAGDYTAEERAILDDSREGLRIYKKEFMGEKNREKREKLEAGDGDPKEIRRYRKARDSFRAYNRTIKNHRSGKVEIEFDPSNRKAVQKLEALRLAYNDFRKKYAGPDKADLRNKLEAGIGTKQEVKSYRNLHESYKEYQRIYLNIRRQILSRVAGKKKEEDKSKGTSKKSRQGKKNATSKQTEPEKITGSGRPRWFDGILKKVKDLSDGTPDKAVYEQPSGGLTNMPGIQAPQDPTSGQQSIGSFMNHLPSGRTETPNVFTFPAVDMDKVGATVGTAINNAAGNVLGVLSEPGAKGFPGVGQWTPSSPPRTPLIP